MKTICILFFLLASITGQTQTFEGSVRWNMSMEITDPAMKAKMAEAQKQLNDPETQAKMKDMEANMNTPEMKKMMEQNPQMKAAMEAAMKSAKGGGGMAGMMPSGMVMKVKGENMVSIMEGGVANGMEVLHMKGQTPTRVNRADKTFSKMPEGPGGGQAPEAKVTKTSETAKLLGYNCQKYIAEVQEHGKTITQIFWTTTEIKDMDMKALARQRMGQGGQSMFYDKMEGVPLKMEFASPEGNMIMEVTEIKRQKVDDADFLIPADFKEVKMPGGR